jgi:uncharacterized protein YbaA (DUF1428 family)
MAYIDGFVIPVPTANRAEFLAHAHLVDAMFLEFGATRVVEGWGDDVPAGKHTDFARAVAATPDETVAFSWIEWPDKATRDAAMERLSADPRMTGAAPPFDGKRMIFGGFAPIYDSAA